MRGDRGFPDGSVYSPRGKEEAKEREEEEEEERTLANLRMKNFDLFTRPAASPATLSSPRQDARQEQGGGRRSEKRGEAESRRDVSSTLLLTLDRDFDKTCSTASSMQAFKDSLLRDCAESLRVPLRQVEVLSVERGSILVKLLLHSDLRAEDLGESPAKGQRRTSLQLARELRTCVSNPMSLLCQRQGVVRAQLLPEQQVIRERKRMEGWEAGGEGQSGLQGGGRREKMFLPADLSSPRQAMVEEPADASFPRWMRQLLQTTDELKTGQHRASSSFSPSSFSPSSFSPNPPGPPSMSVRELRKVNPPLPLPAVH
eukprot:760348-Hanusia_phi.AAC.4